MDLTELLTFFNARKKMVLTDEKKVKSVNARKQKVLTEKGKVKCKCQENNGIDREGESQV